MTDRARPGLVALYDIRPGNGAGQFLQPRPLKYFLKFFFTTGRTSECESASELLTMLQANTELSSWVEWIRCEDEWRSNVITAPRLLSWNTAADVVYLLFIAPRNCV